MSKTSSQFTRQLLRWYDSSRRDLPWRESRDPYRILVSEAMLQQTQVATVIPYFRRFIERFPTVLTLARSDEQEVLRLWQGLGYYRRARNLRRCAQIIVWEHDGVVPDTVEQLLSLPGVGRYTAGAIASIAFDVPAPILDGNVTRVLCRLDKTTRDPREPKINALLWKRADEILPRRRAGDFNSALMELGATVCVPRAPRCEACPVRLHCKAFAAGVQTKIPVPKKSRVVPLHERKVFCIRDASRMGERWLIEQRPARGRWAGLWQFVTIDANEAKAPRLNERLSLQLSPPRKIGSLSHALTHRRYAFDVFRCDFQGALQASSNGQSHWQDAVLRRWVTADEIDRFPFPRPHLKIRRLLNLG